MFGERRSERFKHVTEGRLDSARMAAQNTRQHSSQTVLCPPRGLLRPRREDERKMR